MPKHPNFPTILNHCQVLTIANLRKLDYLHPHRNKYGTLNWHHGCGRYSQLTVYVDMLYPVPNIELVYWYQGRQVTYTVGLVACPSNLGKGKVWYFVCPRTGKKCRKLYRVGKYFGHRDAFPGVVYEKQTFSKKTRALWQTHFEEEALWEGFEKKHRKRHYQGKPTRCYLALLRKLRRRGFLL